MTSLNLQNLLIQQEETKERVLVLWGRICGSLKLDVNMTTEMEALVREYSLLTKIHLHAVANGTVPASLLTVLEEMETRKAKQAAETLPDLESSEELKTEN